MPRAVPPLAELEEAIRQGKGAGVRRALRAITLGDIPRAERPAYVAIARRVDLPALGLRLLGPRVRGKGRGGTGASELEKAEYAGCLVHVGAHAEARALLEGIAGTTAPQAHLFRAFAAIGQWDYAAAIPALRSYLRAPGLGAYRKTVARVNLAEALLHERDFVKAEPLLRDLLHRASLQRWDLVLGRTLELTAEMFLLRRDWARAEAFLAEAGSRLRESESLDALFVEKWKAILALRRGPTRAALDAVARVKDQARRRGHWETLRDCDRYLAILCRDESLFRHVYFGTPFDAFRRRLLEDFPGAPPLTETYDWCPGADGNADAGARVALDLVGGDLDPARAPHRALTALSADFYRPVRAATLFHALYPGEFFDADSSLHRVYNAVRRLRSHLDETGVPVRIEEVEGSYRLSADRVAIRVGAAAATPSSRTARALREAFGATPFSVAEASRALEMPYRSAFRALQDAVTDGALGRTGRGRACRYRVA